MALEIYQIKLETVEDITPVITSEVMMTADENGDLHHGTVQKFFPDSKTLMSIDIPPARLTDPGLLQYDLDALFFDLEYGSIIETKTDGPSGDTATRVIRPEQDQRAGGFTIIFADETEPQICREAV